MFGLIQNWHLLFVHFATVLLIFTGAFQIALWIFKPLVHEPSIYVGQKWLIITGTIAVVLALYTGLLVQTNENLNRSAYLAMTSHKNLALITAIIFIFGSVVYFYLERYRKSLAGICFAASLILVVMTAHKGGVLVFVHGVGVMPQTSSEERIQNHKIDSNEVIKAAETGQISTN